MQALWAAHEPQMDDLTIPFLGPERSARQYPFAGLLAAGAVSSWTICSTGGRRAGPAGSGPAR